VVNNICTTLVGFSPPGDNLTRFPVFGRIRLQVLAQVGKGFKLPLLLLNYCKKPSVLRPTTLNSLGGLKQDLRRQDEARSLGDQADPLWKGISPMQTVICGGRQLSIKLRAKSKMTTNLRRSDAPAQNKAGRGSTKTPRNSTVASRLHP